ncbi:unnamed protein product [Camellia sinensis]
MLTKTRLTFTTKFANIFRGTKLIDDHLFISDSLCHYYFSSLFELIPSHSDGSYTSTNRLIPSLAFDSNSELRVRF